MSRQQARELAFFRILAEDMQQQAETGHPDFRQAAARVAAYARKRVEQLERDTR